MRIKEEKIVGTIYKSEKESSGLFISPREKKKNLPSYLYMSWAPVTSGRPRKSSAKPETRLDLVDLLGWPPAGGGQNMSQEGSAKPARKRSCLMKRICLRYKKASRRVIVKFHHLKTVGCGLVPVTVLPLQNVEALYVGLGLHQIPFAILRLQRSLTTVGPMKETYFIARSVDIEAHTNAAIAQAATFCSLSQISEINNRMGVNHTYMYKLYINPKIPLYFILVYN